MCIADIVGMGLRMRPRLYTYMCIFLIIILYLLTLSLPPPPPSLCVSYWLLISSLHWNFERCWAWILPVNDWKTKINAHKENKFISVTSLLVLYVYMCIPAFLSWTQSREHREYPAPCPEQPRCIEDNQWHHYSHTPTHRLYITHACDDSFYLCLI